MGKRPKNWVPTPAERMKQSKEARWKRGENKKMPDIKFGNGFGNGIVTTPGYGWFPAGEGRIITTPGTPGYTITWERELEVPETPEEKKDPIDEFTDEWYEKNKGDS